MKPPHLPTRVAHAGARDHLLRGCSIFNEIVGKRSLMQANVFAITGRWLDASDAGLLEDLAAVLIGADPRIWPNKVVRLLSAYGSSAAGIAAGELLLDGAWLGFRVGGAVARLLQEVRRRMGPQGDDSTLLQVLRALRKERRFLPGFGVAFRDRDERLERLVHAVRARGADGRPWWRLLEAIRGLDDPRLPPPNIGLGGACILLDLGFDPVELEEVAAFLGEVNFRANAAEGAAQAPEVLRHLPEAFIDDRCTPPRRSPRAEAKDQGT